VRKLKIIPTFFKISITVNVSMIHNAQSRAFLVPHFTYLLHFIQQ